MKAVLITKPDDPSIPVYAVDPGVTIPEGYEVVELLSLDPPDSMLDRSEMCVCGHDRNKHVSYKHQCLVLEDSGRCLCKRFLATETKEV